MPKRKKTKKTEEEEDEKLKNYRSSAFAFIYYTQKLIKMLAMLIKLT